MMNLKLKPTGMNGRLSPRAQFHRMNHSSLLVQKVPKDSFQMAEENQVKGGFMLVKGNWLIIEDLLQNFHSLTIKFIFLMY